MLCVQCSLFIHRYNFSAKIYTTSTFTVCVIELANWTVITISFIVYQRLSKPSIIMVSADCILYIVQICNTLALYTCIYAEQFLFSFFFLYRLMNPRHVYMFCVVYFLCFVIEHFCMAFYYFILVFLLLDLQMERNIIIFSVNIVMVYILRVLYVWRTIWNRYSVLWYTSWLTICYVTQFFFANLTSTT